MARVLFHIDINAFFASAEEIKHPEYKGLPLAVGSLSSRGVLSTANYAAREFGIHSAMPVFEALKICPELNIVQGDYNYYRSLSAQFFQYLHRYSNMIEPASIDECFMDVTDTIKRYKRPLDLAVQIQNGVYETLGLNVSIGVAPNRFLAKMASDMKKPKGITVLRKAEIERKLWPLPIEEMVGIGKKTIPVLKRYGIQTIGDFACPDNENLILRLLSKSGYSLIQKARGNSSAQLNFSTTHKSISISRTYPSDIYTLNDAMERLKTLADDLCRKMIQENQKGKLVSISLRDTNFHNIVRSVPLQTYTNAYVIVFEAASGLLEENFEEVGYRHIGVSMGSLKDANRILEQPSIFETPIQDTDSILAQLNKKLDHKNLFKASDLLKKGNEHE
ncbi:DNA polymerase IV [Faecalitalea cylindroides]|uniref:DNA polymerase IV n=1 Tax=Faecalitalea cylindroides TaxID=39483 RepID=UPI0022E5155A|nr:DNA polymerase IV [Faecalitalea cylindroides]